MIIIAIDNKTYCMTIRNWKIYLLYSLPNFNYHCIGRGCTRVNPLITLYLEFKGHRNSYKIRIAKELNMLSICITFKSICTSTRTKCKDYLDKLRNGFSLKKLRTVWCLTYPHEMGFSNNFDLFPISLCSYNRCIW